MASRLEGAFLTINKSLKSIDNGEKLQHAIDEDCNCHQSAFLYGPVGHVVTGNLDIVEDDSLRAALAKGTKYRPEEAWEGHENALNLLKNGLDLYCKGVARRSKTPIQAFAVYKNRITDIWKCKLQRIATKGREQRRMAGERIVMEKAIRQLQRRFVIAPADKAAGNYIFICKKYYLLAICKELGVNVNGSNISAVGNATYKPVKVPNRDLLEAHKKACTFFKCDTKLYTDVLPILFATPKMHKDPYKFRFIAGARNSSTKPISEMLRKILTCVEEHVKNYFAVVERRTGKKCFWAVNSTQQVLQKIHNKYRIRHMYTADFSTLFTALPHSAIFSNIDYLLDLCFKNSKKKYIACSYSKSFFTNSEAEGKAAFTLQQCKELLRSVVNETYVSFAGQTFKQVLGIAMGNAASSVCSNLVLCGYEVKYCLENRKIITAARYVDDIMVLNCPRFHEFAHEIYGNDLKLEETFRGARCNFLDLDVRTQDGKPSIKVYNKVDAFNFKVNRYGHPHSYVAKNMHKNVIHGQLLRFAAICTAEDGFLEAAKGLCTEMEAKGFGIDFLMDAVLQFLAKNSRLVQKYGISGQEGLACLAKRICKVK